MKETPIYARRSIRKYQHTALSNEIIEQIVDAGRVAPSAKNRQPWQCIVFSGEAKKELLDCMQQGILREKNEIGRLPHSRSGLADAVNTLRIMRQAPITLIVLNTNGGSPFIQVDAEERISEICDTLSIGAFIENMLLKAEELGVGSLWIANTCFAYQELVAYLKTDSQLVGAIALGYANEAPSARPRKSLQDILEYRQ